MNTKLRKIKNNAKALSPVVASIILIAVTVAVSVAVAAWMGGMTLGFMQTEQMNVNTPKFTVGTGAEFWVNNTGTNAIVIQSVEVNGVSATVTNTLPLTIQPNTGVKITVEDDTIAAGNNYKLAVITSKNNQFSLTAIAPQ
jgi:flagellin-like protein